MALCHVSVPQIHTLALRRGHLRQHRHKWSHKRQYTDCVSLHHTYTHSLSCQGGRQRRITVPRASKPRGARKEICMRISHFPAAFFVASAPHVFPHGMIIPVRCFSCGKVIGDKWDAYLALLIEGRTEGEALTELQLQRYCCRRMVLTHVDLIERLLHYNSMCSALTVQSMNASPSPLRNPCRLMIMCTYSSARCERTSRSICRRASCCG